MYTSHIVEYVVHMHNTTLKLASTCRSRGQSTCYKFTYSRGVFNTTAFNTWYTTCNWSYSLSININIYIYTYVHTYKRRIIVLPGTTLLLFCILHTYVCMYMKNMAHSLSLKLLKHLENLDFRGFCRKHIIRVHGEAATGTCRNKGAWIVFWKTCLRF